MREINPLVLIIICIFLVFSCDNKEPGSDSEANGTMQQEQSENDKSANIADDGKNNKDFPPEIEAMLDDIEDCLSAAVDNAETEDEARSLMKQCESNLMKKYNDKFESDPQFKKYFQDEGGRIYNMQKIRMKEKFSGK